jgi:CRISPR/Cas system CMR-associated protein Cmr5 small subunit
MKHPTAQVPKRNRFSNQMKSIFDHNLEEEPEPVNSMRKQIPRAKETNLNLGFEDSKPENFYQTSNQKYFSNRKPKKGVNESVQNFKDKNSRDHLVFGNYKNKYATETNSNYLNYDIGSAISGNQALPHRNKRSFNPLSFDQKNNFKSTYGANYTEKQNPDSLNTFMNNFSEKQKQYASNIMMEQGKTDYQSSYKANYNSKVQQQRPEDLIDMHSRKFQNKTNNFRNIIAFEERNPGKENLKNTGNQFRKNTPFGTSYNKDFKKHALQSRKKHFPNLQKTNFFMGDFPMNYMTHNKENFQNNVNVEPMLVAGKPSQTKKDNLQNIMSGHGYTGQTDYDVFINKGKDKLNYI